MALLKTLGEKGIVIYKEQDKSDEKDIELIEVALKEENRDRCFLTLAETLKAPLWMFKGKVIQSGKRE